ncbi:MAG: hypothetical protein ABIA47_02750 [bacterium]
MEDALGYTLLVTMFWFPIYWIFGGVFFATVAIFKIIKLRKARFSCLFTVLTAGAAYAAARAGMMYGERQITECLEQADGFFNAIASVIACGVLELSLAGLVGFLLLLVAGFAALFVSRSGNGSWIDADFGLKQEVAEEIEFEE